MKNFNFENEDGQSPADPGDRWLPVAKNGDVCPLTGLKHAKLYTLLDEVYTDVRVVQLRKAGCTRGQTLFHAGDMLRYLTKLSAEQS